ncbi:hypothetical protein N9893_01010 [bacterium]|nr:hypothetical protein [bacterium]
MICMKILKQTMIEAAQHYLKSIPVDVDLVVADNWAVSSFKPKTYSKCSFSAVLWNTMRMSLSID